jgi:hypothetical protein
MDFSDFSNIALLASLVILISAGLDRLVAHVAPAQILYYAIRMPGIVLHELAHVLGCLITGAGIKKVVLFSRDGGSVTYSKPALPLFGNLIISTAPLIVLPVVLACLTWLFGKFLGCFLPPILPPSPGTVAGIQQMVVAIIGIFTTNIVTHLNGWFFLYLYLAASIVLSLSPSVQDFKNAVVGITAFVVLCLVIIWTGSAPAGALLALVIAPLSTAFSLGILFEMIVFFASVPFVIISLIITR